MKVRIKNLAKNPMQSGLGKNDLWTVSIIEDSNIRSVNDVTGWTSASDTKSQLRIKFKSKEDAISYAEDKGYDYVIDEANKPSIKSKSYSNNFTKPIL